MFFQYKEEDFSCPLHCIGHKVTIILSFFFAKKFQKITCLILHFDIESIALEDITCERHQTSFEDTIRNIMQYRL